MSELITEALGHHQLPLTILLGFVMLYWILVAAGMLECDVESGTHAHDGSLDHGGSPDHSGALGAAWATAGRWLGFSSVPLVVWASFFILYLWIAALILNAVFNGQPGERGVITALILVVPSTFASLIMTRLSTWPLGRLFNLLAQAKTEAVEVIGLTGVVTTSAVDERFGRLEITTQGAPVILIVRVAPGERHLARGEHARVMKSSADGAYLVAPAHVPDTLC
jgi:hypothetical protein